MFADILPGGFTADFPHTDVLSEILGQVASKITAHECTELKINPFQPAAVKGAPIDMLTHCEQLTALVNATLPTSDILPVIIDEAFFTFLSEIYKNEFTSGEMQQKEDYPKLDKVLPVARRILDGRGYAPDSFVA